jgi:CRP-like cAMP-binding protein
LDILIVSIGRAEVLSAEGNSIKILSDGSFFGEIALLFANRRTATVQAITHCDMFVLTRRDFIQVLKRFPRLAKVFLQMKKQYTIT